MVSSLVVLYIFFLASVYTAAIDDGVGSGPSSEPSACPEIPTVENAEVSIASLKSKYTAGDSLTYICQQGYVGRVIFSCDGHKWQNTRNSKCSRKRCGVPEDIPNGRFILVNGTELTYGSTIKYTCKTGYRMVRLVDTRTCLAEGWSNNLPECEEILCDSPEAKDHVIVDGFSDDGDKLKNGHLLQFRCDSVELKLVGARELICGENGEWNNTFPTCEEIICKLEEIHGRVSVVGLPKNNAPIKYGHKLQFYCKSDLVIKGNQEVTCSNEGNWSSPFPICEERKGCGPPPPIESADLTTLQKPYYNYGEKVEYRCQKLYTISGSPVMTCEQDTWTGVVRCLKPCTVTIRDMDAHHIQQFYGKKKEMNSEHNDHITFACQKGKRPNYNMDFRQKCIDGRIFLPSCY